MPSPYTRGSAVIYEGASVLDGSPIVVILTGLGAASRNVKTGALVQSHIIRRDMSPADAIREGQDAGSICPATCPHLIMGTCYVHPIIKRGQGTSGAFRSYHAGRYRVADRDSLIALGAGRDIRLGSYGDPCAVPYWVWETLLVASSSNTGYTHGWRLPSAQRLRAYCMASVDSPDSAREAIGAGWRVYLPEPHGVKTRKIGADTLATCPASAEAGHVRTCATCPPKLRCSGNRHGSSIQGVRITAHGSSAARVVATD